METLDELITSYGKNKNDLDTLDKVCKAENNQIKTLMAESKEDEHTAGGYTAKIVVQHKDSMDEAKLLEVLKKHNITTAIRQIEVVDMDALEAYLYNNQSSPELACDLAGCKKSTEVVTLRIGKEKVKKEV